MAPRALLLSADEKVNAVLQEVLATARCELNCCKDIFSAAEAITRDRFDVLLIDWQEVLEANFLLTTARDLKCNQAVFAVALVPPSQGREALESGANAILVKPFTAAQVAEMILPKLGSECGPPANPNPAFEAKIARATLEQGRHPAQLLPTSSHPAVKREFKEVPEQVESTPIRSHSSASEPSLRRPSRRSRMLTLMAIVWPLIIVVALLAFDQWPHIPQLARLARSRLDTLPTHATDEQLSPRETPIQMHDDLLSDYAAPVALSQSAAQHDDSIPRKPADIDLVSLGALPASRRVLSPVFTLEQSHPKVEVPSSLLYPPRAQTVLAVAPAGHLIAPDWSEVPISLPEAASRMLLEHQVMPQYPDQALPTGAEGSVVLQAWIAKDGSVRELKLVSGYLVLARAAMDAVKQWRYKPYRHNGQTVEVETLITVSFKQPPRG